MSHADTLSLKSRLGVVGLPEAATRRVPMSLISTRNHSSQCVPACNHTFLADQTLRPSGIDVTMSEKAGEVTVHLKGEVPAIEGGALEARLRGLSSRVHDRVTIDLSEVTFLSALAMGVLVRFRRAVVRAGGRMHFSPTLQPQVRESLEVAKLTALFELATESSTR